MKKNNRNITERHVNFAKWYTDIIKQADLCDYADENGGTKGAIVFRPNGYKIWENIQAKLNIEFRNLGVDNVMLPLLITEKAFAQEKSHIAGFAPECAIVTRVGDKELQEPFIIRPTSEVLFGRHFQRVVKGYRQLPLLYNQWCNVIRWEKTTRPFLRNSEFLWQEGHTVHSDAEEAMNFALNMIKLYAKFVESQLGIYAIVGTKTPHERFAGALETYTIETMMQDGQALQAGTSHYFGQKFAEIFNIKFSNKENKQELAYQTSWGVSTRLIGALIMAHSDDLGLVLPGTIAPTPIVILNVLPKNEAISAFVNEVADVLKSKYLVKVNHEDKSLGFKKGEAEIQGIPLVIEIGMKEIESKELTIIPRVTGESQKLDFNDQTSFLIGIDKLITESQEKLLTKSKKTFEKNLIEILSFSEYKKIIGQHKGYVIAPFCGLLECEIEIKTLTKTTSRCIPLTPYKEASDCFKCNKPNSPWTYFARAY